MTNPTLDQFIESLEHELAYGYTGNVNGEPFTKKDKTKQEKLKSQLESKLAQADGQKKEIVCCSCPTRFELDPDCKIHTPPLRRQEISLYEKDKQIQKLELKIMLNEQELSQLRPIMQALKELYNSEFPFNNNSPRDWFAEIANILKDEPYPQWALDEYCDLKQKSILATSEAKP